LAEVAEFLDSRRKPVKESERKPGPYPYYGANGQQGSIDGYLFDEPLILLAEDGGFFDQPDRGIAYRVSGKTWVNNHAHVIRPRQGVDLAFLCRVLENYDVLPFISGSTRAKLTKGQAEKIEIPLPPLDEQKRIAAILDQADELRRKRQRAIDRLNQLGQSIFHEMFGDATANPMGWRTAQLGDIVRSGDKINYGVVQPGEDVEKGVPLVRVGDLLSGYIDPGKVKQIDATIEAGYKRSRLVGDEILIGCVGSIGTVALAHEGLRGANIARAVARIPVDASIAMRDFIAEQIKSPVIQRYFTSETRTVAQPTLNIGLIVSAPIILPPLSEQKRFAEVIAGARITLKNFMDHGSKQDELFASLQHRAFQGEL
jgi:type I restriction enzyme S subunit